MHAYPIDTALHMTSQDAYLLESVTDSIIYTTPGRTLVLCEPHKFATFSAIWNSYRKCLINHDPVKAIRDWRESIQKEFAP